jgi:hypothetical protein
MLRVLSILLTLLALAPAANKDRRKGGVKPDPQAQKLVRQLGSSDFAQREAAEKALTNMGARAAASVRAGRGDAAWSRMGGRGPAATPTSRATRATGSP